MVHDIIVAIHRKDAIVAGTSPNLWVSLQDLLRLSVKRAKGIFSRDIAHAIRVVSPSFSKDDISYPSQIVLKKGGVIGNHTTHPPVLYR